MKSLITKVTPKLESQMQLISKRPELLGYSPFGFDFDYKDISLLSVIDRTNYLRSLKTQNKMHICQISYLYPEFIKCALIEACKLDKKTN